jgi:uncharacterized protein
MKVALIGATGNAGSRILSELAHRGHSVTAIVRNPERVPATDGVLAAKGDAFDPKELARLLTGHDAVVSAIRFTDSDPRKLIEAVRTSGAMRYIVVGGAGCLEVAPGVKLMEAPGFPPEYKAEAAAGGAFLDLLRAQKTLDWTFICPSALFIPGERTGTFRIGKDQLLANDQGSSISFEDYAMALVDELEIPAHSRERFTVGY